MSISSIRVHITPREAFDLIRGNMGEELIYKEFHELKNGIETGILVFEKYYMRSGIRASLTVTIHNFDQTTEVVGIPAGCSRGMIFNCDLGTGDHFAKKMINILKNYRVS